MAKRFTETDKWKDKWFRSLRPEYKLAYLYLLDNCDPAGVIDIDEELAEFQIGMAIDWDSFFRLAENRITKIRNGKRWITKFIDYQYTNLGDSNAHIPVKKSIERNDLPYENPRVREGFAKGLRRSQVKEKEKEKETDKEKEQEQDREGVQGEGPADPSGWVIPERLDTPEVRLLLGKFAEMRRKIKKPIRDFAGSSLVFKRFESVEHLVYAIEHCIANEYQGLKPDYRPLASRLTSAEGRQASFTQLRLLNSQNAIQEFVND